MSRRTCLTPLLPIVVASIRQSARQRAPSLSRIQRSAATSPAALLALRATSPSNISPTEERVLVKYILRLDSFSNPISPAFTRQLAYEIRISREKRLASTTPLPFPGKHSVDRLRGRYPVIQSAYTRQPEAGRVVGTDYTIVAAYFEALSTLFLENSYLPDDIYNFDETGFSLGTSQSTRVLTNSKRKTPDKKIPGRQE